MSEREFYAAVGELTRSQGWSLDSVATLALGFIGAQQTRREQFIRHLRRVAREENGSATD